MHVEGFSTIMDRSVIFYVDMFFFQSSPDHCLKMAGKSRKAKTTDAAP